MDVNSGTRNISTKFRAIIPRIAIFRNFLVIKNGKITKIIKNTKLCRTKFLMPFVMISHHTSRNKFKESSKSRILVIGHRHAKHLPRHLPRHWLCTRQGTRQGTGQGTRQCTCLPSHSTSPYRGKLSVQRSRNRFKLCTDINNITEDHSAEFRAIIPRIYIFLNFFAIKTRKITKILKIPKSDQRT
jgi:hypothetical protein